MPHMHTHFLKTVILYCTVTVSRVFAKITKNAQKYFYRTRALPWSAGETKTTPASFPVLQRCTAVKKRKKDTLA